jgi:hypothetical protein
MAEQPGLEQILYVSWEEREKDGGCWPDGCSLHLTKEDYDLFLKQYWDKQCADLERITSIETFYLWYSVFSFPEGKIDLAYATPELYQQVKESTHGLRFFEKDEAKLVADGKLVYD